MSQRVLINIHGTSKKIPWQPRLPHPKTRADAVVGHTHQRVFVSHQMSAPRDASQAMRSQTACSVKDGAATTTSALDVQVQIEQTTTVDYDPVYGREEYRRLWDRKLSASPEGGDGSSTEQIQWDPAGVRSVANNVEMV